MCKRMIVTFAVLAVIAFVLLLLLYVVGTVWGAPPAPTDYLPLVLAITPPPSAGPLDFPEPTQLDGYETVEGGYRCLIVVRISGGAPPFTIYHDGFQDATNEREYLLYFVEAGCTIVHAIRVDSADGQSLSRSYWISSPWCN